MVLAKKMKKKSSKGLNAEKMIDQAMAENASVDSGMGVCDCCESGDCGCSCHSMASCGCGDASCGPKGDCCGGSCGCSDTSDNCGSGCCCDDKPMIEMSMEEMDGFLLDAVEEVWMELFEEAVRKELLKKKGKQIAKMASDMVKRSSDAWDAKMKGAK